jgi:hypothetical protein
MADVNYVITIRSEGGGEEEAPKKIASTASGESVEPEKKPSTFEDFKKKAKKPAMVAKAYALKYADLAITTEINRVELRTGSSLLQEQISYKYDMTKRVFLAGALIVGGAVAGNPLAIVAGITSIADIGIQQSIARENMNIAKTVESIGINQANIRAGSNGGRFGNYR